MRSVTSLSSAAQMKLARVVERHPYLWKVCWETVKRTPILLPHDRSYNAFRHFIRAVPDGLFLDVGANDGISALGFRKLSASYRILSIEPNALLEPALKKLKRRDRRFDYRLVGAGSTAGSVDLFMPVCGGVRMHTYTSASAEQVKLALEQICGKRVAGRAVIEKIQAPIVTIDSLEVDPSIVKIDVEGFDYEALSGAAGTISRTRPFITAELAWFRLELLEEFFEKRDYELFSYDVLRDEFGAAQMREQAQQGERNSFAIPREWIAKMPLAASYRAAAGRKGGR